jgi:alkylhydroperoxidase/carboxymuconolactone decarboxylase family protein YurZ
MSSRPEPGTEFATDSRLDDRSSALVQIGAAVCCSGPTTLLSDLVRQAREAGSSDSEILGAFLSVAAVAGEPLVVRVAPRISLALGYDVDRAFELE